jgi:hypothetical protein
MIGEKEGSMSDVIEATERAVNALCRDCRIYSEDARQLVRVEVNYDTWAKLHGYSLASCKIDNVAECRQRREPMKVRGVSYYLVEELECIWRVIGISVFNGGRPKVLVVNAPHRDREHEFDEASKQRG